MKLRKREKDKKMLKQMFSEKRWKIEGKKSMNAENEMKIEGKKSMNAENEIEKKRKGQEDA